MHALEELQGIYETELLFVESGGDNLAGESGVPSRHRS
jgi:Ni2+-binding GTPase involved in maturation of urease and hydrogenase